MIPTQLAPSAGKGKEERKTVIVKTLKAAIKAIN